MRTARSYPWRWLFCTITSSFMPVASGRRSIFSGSVPATHAAATWQRAAAQPLTMRPHSHSISSAMRAPTASASSSRWT